MPPNSVQADHAVLFCNGPAESVAFQPSWSEADLYVVAVDGGARHCLDCGLVPDILIGDLDSLAPDLQQRLRDQGVPFEVHPPRKASTDLDLAMRHVAGLGIRRATLCGFWGGRLDQSIANLLLLSKYLRQVSVTAVTSGSMVRMLGEGESMLIEDRVGATASVLPLSPRVEGVTLRGMEYPLENALIEFGTTLGVSNVVRSDPATVAVRQGLLLVIVEEPD